ncbi:tRNA (guanine(9)-N(1))-methyltransferase [Coniothyrium glycines]
MDSDERPCKMRKLGHSDCADVQQDSETLTSTIINEETSGTTINAEIPTNRVNTNKTSAEDGGEGQKISKNQLKKQRRHERWEAGRQDRKVKRKEKIKEKKERRREERAQGTAIPPARISRNSAGVGQQVPITVIFDCDFEDLMFDNELKSLGLQITRCYSDNRKAKFRTHLALSSFGGKMKERFDGILAQQYTAWKGFQFFEEDFVAVAEKSKVWMSSPKGGDIGGALENRDDTSSGKQDHTDEDDEEGEIIYLSSESDNVLTHLKPNSTYIIGGLVDKNRHKGVCHKRAVNRGIKTAKLPIGEYLEMKSRQVLVTNHVLEIMLKWLELGDWGQAFMAVMPKRKGGKLKGDMDGDEENNVVEDSIVDDEKHADEEPVANGDIQECAEVLDGSDRISAENHTTTRMEGTEQAS